MYRRENAQGQRAEERGFALSSDNLELPGARVPGALSRCDRTVSRAPHPLPENVQPRATREFPQRGDAMTARVSLCFIRYPAEPGTLVPPMAHAT